MTLANASDSQAYANKVSLEYSPSSRLPLCLRGQFSLALGDGFFQFWGAFGPLLRR